MPEFIVGTTPIKVVDSDINRRSLLIYNGPTYELVAARERRLPWPRPDHRYVQVAWSSSPEGASLLRGVIIPRCGQFYSDQYTGPVWLVAEKLTQVTVELEVAVPGGDGYVRLAAHE